MTDLAYARYICTEFGNQSEKIRTETKVSSLKAKVAEQNAKFNFANQKILNLRQIVDKKTQQLEGHVNYITILNTRISKLHAQLSSRNDQIHKLQCEISKTFASPQGSFSIKTTISRPPRTKSD